MCLSYVMLDLGHAVAVCGSCYEDDVVHGSLVMFEGECGCDVMDVVMLWSSSSGSCHVERGMM